MNWNSARYSSPKDALKSNNHDGLTVLGVFIQVILIILKKFKISIFKARFICFVSLRLERNIPKLKR